MNYSLLADMTVLVHSLFVVFVIGGGIAALRWPKLVWLHIPAAVWGVSVELSGGVCPLTYLENYWRQMGGEKGYEAGCIQHYLEPLLYPVGLTPEDQKLLGIMALLLNILVYVVVWRRFRRTM